MGENEQALENKKQALKEELSRPDWSQNKFKIQRLQESIKRHKEIAIGIKEKYQRKAKYKEKNGRRR